MWSSPFISLKIRVTKDAHKGIGLPIPLPLYVLQETLDDLGDLLTLIGYLVPKFSTPAPPLATERPNFHLIKETFHLIQNLFSELTHCGSFDLVDVETPEVTVKIRIF